MQEPSEDKTKKLGEVADFLDRWLHIYGDELFDVCLFLFF